MKTCSDDFKSQLAAKDKVIHCLQEDLSKALFDRDQAINENLEKKSIISVLKKQLQDSEESELRRVGEIASKDIRIMKFQAELQVCEQQKQDLQTELEKMMDKKDEESQEQPPRCNK